jgi:hypothetical protein
MFTGAPYSRSNIGRISLNAGLKLGGAPTDSGSACNGSQIPTMAANPAIAAFNARLSNSEPPNLLDAPCTQDCLGA